MAITTTSRFVVDDSAWPHTSGSFTPAAGSLLVVMVTNLSEFLQTTTTFSVSSSPSLTWTRQVRSQAGNSGNGLACCVEIWTAEVASSTSMTVTANVTAGGTVDAATVSMSVTEVNGHHPTNYIGLSGTENAAQLVPHSGTQETSLGGTTSAGSVVFSVLLGDGDSSETINTINITNSGATELIAAVNGSPGWARVTHGYFPGPATEATWSSWTTAYGHADAALEIKASTPLERTTVGRWLGSTSGSFTPPNNCLLVAVWTTVGYGTFNSSSLCSGGGLTWSEAVGLSNYGNNDPPPQYYLQTKVAYAHVTTGSSMTITIADGNGGELQVFAYENYDTGSPIGATVEHDTQNTTGPLTINLSSAPASSSEVLAGRAGVDWAAYNTTATPGTGWTELYDTSNPGGYQDLQTQYRSGSTSTAVDWADVDDVSGPSRLAFHAFAIEIKAAGGVPDPSVGAASGSASVSAVGIQGYVSAGAAVGAGVPAAIGGWAAGIYSPSPALNTPNDNPDLNFRIFTQITAASNGYLRVKFKAGTSGGAFWIDGASFGKWNGDALSSASADTTTAPFRLTFGGANDVQIPQGQEAYSDWVAHPGVTLNAGDWVIVIYKTDGGSTQGNMMYNSSGSTTALTIFRATATDQSQLQSISGHAGYVESGSAGQPGNSGGRNFGVERVETIQSSVELTGVGDSDGAATVLGTGIAVVTMPPDGDVSPGEWLSSVAGPGPLQTVNLVVVGDSVLATQDGTSFPGELVALLSGVADITLTNFSVSGQTLEQQAALYASEPGAEYNAAFDRNICIIHPGSNDLLSDISLVDWQTLAQDYVDDLVATGYEVITVEAYQWDFDLYPGYVFNTASDWAAYNSCVSSLNGIRGVINTSAIRELTNQLNVNRPPYYADDQHLLAAGTELWAAFAEPIVSAIIESSPTLYDAVDEATPDDSDYIRSGNNPVNDTCVMSLTNPPAGVADPFKVTYRYRGVGNSLLDLRVRLLEGTTQIASWEHTGIGPDWVTTTQTLTAPELASITDPNNLRIEIRANRP